MASRSLVLRGAEVRIGFQKKKFNLSFFLSLITLFSSLKPLKKNLAFPSTPHPSDRSSVTIRGRVTYMSEPLLFRCSAVRRPLGGLCLCEAHTHFCSLTRTSSNRPTFCSRFYFFSLSAISVLSISYRFFSPYSLVLSLIYLHIFFALPPSPFAPHTSLRVIFIPLRPCTLSAFSSLQWSPLTPLVWILRHDIDLALQMLLQRSWMWAGGGRLGGSLSL